MNTKLLILIPLVFFLSSCSENKKKEINLQLSYIPTSSVPQRSVTYHTQKELRQASQSMDQSMNTLAKMKMAESPVGRFQPPADAKEIHMNRRMTINWNGPMLAAVNKIATYTNYKVRVIGKVPAVPLIVNLSMKNQQIANVLRNIQYQTYNRAKIVVYPATDYIEIRYVT